MRIDAAAWGEGELVLVTSSPEARKFAYRFKPGEYEIVKTTRKRSLDANAYCSAFIPFISTGLVSSLPA